MSDDWSEFPEVGQAAPKRKTLSPQARSFYDDDEPNMLEQFGGGAKHAWDRAASGLASLFGDDSLKPLVSQGQAFVKETGPASTVGQIGGDIAMTAVPAVKAYQLGKAASTMLPRALGTAAPVAAEAGAMAGYGAMTADEGQAAQGAAAGAIGTGVAHALPGAVRAVGRGASDMLGMTTGAGGEAVRQATRAGAAGGQTSDDFLRNMRGVADPAEVVGQARQGVHNMRDAMRQSYATGKNGWANDTTLLNFRQVQDSANRAAQRFSFNGVPQPGTAEVRQQVNNILSEWSKRGATDPRFFTVEGFDALKRHLQDVVPDNVANRTGRAYVTSVVDSVKESITRQAPKYKTAMQDYWQRANELDELERALSLGDKATVDTALRKLQSLTRNNAFANYGQRMKGAEALSAKGGVDVMPALSGQALNSWPPRGIQGAIAPFGGAYAAMSSPGALLAAPALSPRIVGETAHALGTASRLTPTRANAAIQALRRKGVAPATIALSRDDDEWGQFPEAP